MAAVDPSGKQGVTVVALRSYKLVARLLAPVVIKRNRQSQRSESLGSASGSVVRGALAAEYLRQHGEPDEMFRMLFLDPSCCRFGPLDPGPMVLPATAAACKRHGARHGFVDLLWLRMLQHLVGPGYRPEAVGRWQSCRAADCAADLKRYDGFAVTNGRGLEPANASMFVSMHVGIDRLTGTAAQGVLYTLEAIAPNTPLVATVRATEEAANGLRTLLTAADGVIYLGHHRTRGYGRVQLTLQDMPQPDEAAEQERWLTWSARFIEFAREWGPRLTGGPAPELSEEQDFFFALGFPNGAILVDEVLRYTLDPGYAIDWLPPLPRPQELFPFDRRPTRGLGNGGTLVCVAAVTEHELLRGWHAAQGLPKQDESMVARGAVYAYRYRGDRAGRTELLQRLAALTASAVGLRRSEGFGEVSVSDEFHQRYV